MNPTLQPIDTSQLMLPSPRKKHPGGRPSNLTVASLAKLIAAFQRGDTDEEACQYARIHPATYYRWKNKDEQFREQIEDAKNFWLESAGNIIHEVLLNPRVPWKIKETTAWRIMEAKRPNIYGPKAIQLQQQNNQQNNYYVTTPEHTRAIAEQPAVETTDPAELLKALENPPGMDTGTEEERAMGIYQDEIRREDTTQSDLSDSPAPL